MNWIAFVIPMLFVNVTFIKQSLSDPFGWDGISLARQILHGNQFYTKVLIPWFQAVAV